ncbi:hypothetical protein P7C73_g163, partial [Tremellales sp. Uapishka_1]
MPRRGRPNGGLGSEIREALGIETSAEEAARRAAGIGSGGTGYEVESVCLPCLSMLQVTAAPLQTLRSLPLKRLKDYLSAYDLPCVGPKEKEDFVQAVVRARNPATGCLAPESESFYRRRSVPKLGLPPSTSSTPPSRPGSARPPPQSRSPAPQSRPPVAQPRPPVAQPRPQQAGSPQQARPPQPYHQAPQSHPRPSPLNRQTVPPRTTPAPWAQPPPPKPKPAPPPPVPTILSLVSLPKSYLSTLNIGTLKAVLFENHVRVDFKQVLEKEELINRVFELVSDERKRLERQRVEEEREAQNGDAQPSAEIGEEMAQQKPVPTGPMPEIDRGLCVVCQDEEATLAVVDCGHLAMCAPCSELIMATSQECPLCRTRIVTSQRLIRIYRT